MMRGNWFGNGFCPLWGGSNMFGFWNILLLVGVVILIVGIALIIKNKKHDSTEVLELLKIEFVNGKINKEEYLNRKSVIERK